MIWYRRQSAIIWVIHIISFATLCNSLGVFCKSFLSIYYGLCRLWGCLRCCPNQRLATFEFVIFAFHREEISCLLETPDTSSEKKTPYSSEESVSLVYTRSPLPQQADGQVPFPWSANRPCQISKFWKGSDLAHWTCTRIIPTGFSTRFASSLSLQITWDRWVYL